MGKVVAGVVVVALIVAGILIAANHKSKAPAAASTSGQSSSTSGTSSGNVAITGGTNGPECDSGGYFKPSSVTIKSGETVTFSVPSDDPYAGGLQINGLPGGSIVVPRGGSKTTPPITSTVSFHGTWPNETACVKDSGTITVQ